jgi:hypothetical protein
VAEHRALDLEPRAVGLDDHARVVGEGAVERGLQLGLVRDPHDPDRRSEPRRLDPAGEPDVRQVGLVAAVLLDERVGDLRDPRDGHEVLEDDLVHARRAREHARSDVRHVEQLEQPLNGPVLAERPVQHREHRVAAEQAARCAQRHLLAVDHPAAVVLHKDLDDLVARLAQAGRDRGAAVERDVVLGRPAALEDRDPQGVVGVVGVVGVPSPCRFGLKRPTTIFTVEFFFALPLSGV